MDLIDQISNKKLKKRIIESCINEESSNSRSAEDKIDNYGIIKNEGYSLTKVFKRMEVKDSSRPKNLKGLKMKVNNLKLEIKQLKQKQSNTEKRILNLGFQVSQLLTEKNKNLNTDSSD